MNGIDVIDLNYQSFIDISRSRFEYRNPVKEGDGKKLNINLILSNIQVWSYLFSQGISDFSSSRINPHDINHCLWYIKLVCFFTSSHPSRNTVTFHSNDKRHINEIHVWISSWILHSLPTIWSWICNHSASIHMSQVSSCNY